MSEQFMHPTFLFKRSNTPDDPYMSLSYEDEIKSSARLVLREIPLYNDGVSITYNGDKLQETTEIFPSEKQYRVDYTDGVVIFHESMKNKIVHVEYTGIGYINFPVDRIITNDDPFETLGESLKSVEKGVEVLQSMDDFRFTGVYESSRVYTKWNFVFYNNKTYVALDTVSEETPDESDKWLLVSSGIGFRGEYQEEKTYRIGDIVSDNKLNNVYFSKIDNNNNPLDDINSWDRVLSLDEISDYLDGKLEDIEETLELIEQSEIEREEKELKRQEDFETMLLDFDSLNDIINGEEEVRINNEQNRIVSEDQRKLDEQERRTNEQERQVNEELRITAESERQGRFNSLFDSINDYFTTVQQQIQDEINRNVEAKQEIETSLASIEDVVEAIQELSNDLLDFGYVGEFDEEKDYRKGNIVGYNGSTYIAIQDTEQNDIFDENYWKPFALRGLSNVDISIEGATPDESGEITLDNLDIVRQTTYNEFVDNITADMGDLSNLRTVRRDNIVEAINELKNRVDELTELLA